MDENRDQEYLNLIQALLTCPSGQEGQILANNWELLDSGLVQKMVQVAQMLTERGEENTANWIMNLDRKIADNLKLPPHSHNKATSSSQLNFLLDILETIGESRGDEQVVYPLLQANLDKLDDNFVLVLREWANRTSLNTSIAIEIASLSDLIKDFHLGSKASNIEIAISGYEVALRVFTRKDHPEMWAVITNNLGSAYCLRLRGDEAENLENAIACYQAALQIRTREASASDWANTLGNLGLAYSLRIRGDIAENLENAIACYQNALQVLTHSAVPHLLAIMQYNLGTAYRKRIQGEAAENIELAIACYQAALQVRTRQAFPEEWAMTQSNLGKAYSERISGEKAQNLEAAIAYYQAALQVYTRETFPKDWAIIHNHLGDIYTDRILGEKAQNLEAAIASYQAALQVYTREAFPKDWATTQNNLGVQYFQRIRGKKAQNLEVAIACFQAALQVLKRETCPQDWAITQRNLGQIYSDRIFGEKAQNLEVAITSYQAALQVYTREAFPQDWAITQNNMGFAYSQRIYGGKAENLEAAISCYQAELKVRTHEAFPRNWAMTQYNLGNTYRDRIWGNKAENLEAAISCYQAALKVRTREAFPEDWAATQYNLAIAYLQRIRGDKAENLENAIACNQAALKVRTREALPEDWAKTLMHLGVTFNDRIRGDKTQNLETAINCFEAALQIYTREAFSQGWAATQNNLGLAYKAYSYISRKDEAENLEKAITCHQAALQVLTREAFPEDWAKTLINLASAYSERIQGEKTENIERAIACNQAALQVFTREAFPDYWASVQNNLAGDYSKQIQGEKAAITCYQAALQVRTREAFPEEYVVTHFNLGQVYRDAQQPSKAFNAFATAIDTVEFLRGDIRSGDEAKQKLAEEWNKLYINIVEVCIELHDYAVAMEYAERSKTRNLIELLTTRDLYPKGNIPQTVLNQLNCLRQEIETEQRRLEIQERNRTQRNRTHAMILKELSQQLDSIPDRTKLYQLQQQLDEFITRNITPIDPNFHLTQKVEPITFSEIQALTAENTTILEWYIVDGKFLTFVVTSQSQTPLLWQSTPQDYQNLRKWFFEEYIDDYYEQQSQWQNQLEKRLGELAKILHIDEILAKIPPQCDKLILIPHQLLHILPLHALPVGIDKKSNCISCLLDRFPGGVKYAPSCQLLQQAQARLRTNFHRLFAIQNPTEDLDYSDIEVQAIGQYFHSKHILVKSEAKKSTLDLKTFHTSLQDAHCIHFSCHGYFNFLNPLISTLHLADSSIKHIPPEPDPTGNLILLNNKAIDLSKCLTLADILNLDLSQSRLVTLSACETGFTDFISYSDEYMSLTTGFLVAGSPSVVSSLWRVNDLSTSLLMIRFYQNFKAGSTVAVALNQAQLWLRDVTKEELQQWTSQLALNPAHKSQLMLLLKILKDKPFESPYYWAAFCAIGQ